MVLDQSVERVALGAAPGAYTYQQQGINLVVYSGTTVVTTVPLQAGANGTALTFTTGTVKAVVSATGMTLGGTAVTAGTTAAAATLVAPTVIDNTVTSTPVVTTPTLPTLSVASASLAEGNTGTANMTFTVSLSAASTSAVTVAYTTTSGTAVAGSDFTATSGTLTIAAGSTSNTINVPVLGDTVFEQNEAFTLTLSSPTNATVSTASATGTITNDDTNALPALVLPTSAAAAFIGNSTSITGISFTDADDNAGFTVTLQATGSSQLSISNLTATSNNVVGAVNAAGVNVPQNTTSNLITLSGSKADINSVLANLKYATNSTIPTNESIALTVTDPNGGRTTGTLAVNIGNSLNLTSSTTDNLVGSAGDDLFSGAFGDLTSADTIAAAAGTDKLTLTAVTGTVAGIISGVEVLDLTLTGGSTVTVSSTNFGSSLNTINLSGNQTLTTTANSGSTFNLAASTTGALTVANLLVASTGVASAVTTDALTFNLIGTSAAASVLTSIADTVNTIDTLNIVSTGTFATANSIATLGALGPNATVNISGPQAFTITNTLPNLGTTGSISAANATGKITLSAGSTATTVSGGAAGDVLTGGGASDSISGGAGNDTIDGGASNDAITGGLGADSITGGTGVNTFVFAPGDSPSTGRDTLVDLKENDVIKFGTTALTGLTNGALTTSSANTIYVDNVNNRLVVGADQITIPSTVVNAAFTYASDANGGTLTVGAAPLTATNNSLGTLTLTGKAIGPVAVVVDGSVAPTVGGTITGSNAVTTVTATNVTNQGINQTLNVANGNVAVTQSLTLTGSSQADTLTGGAGTDSIVGGSGDDQITGGAGVDTITGGAGNDVFIITGSAQAVTGNAAIDLIDGGAGTGDELRLSTATTIAGTDILTRITNVEKITSDANAGIVSLTLTTANLAGTGFTSVDLSGDTDSTASNVVNLANGGAVTGITAVTGGAGIETITLGAVSTAATLVGGGGVDVFTLAATNNATVAYAAAADVATDNTIGDFTVGSDVLAFAAAFVTGSAAGTLVAADYMEVSAASNATAATEATNIANAIDAVANVATANVIVILDSDAGAAALDATSIAAGTLASGLLGSGFVLAVADDAALTAATLYYDADFNSAGGLVLVGTITTSANFALANISQANFTIV